MTATLDSVASKRKDKPEPTTEQKVAEELVRRARLVVGDGEGHLGIFDHLGKMLDALTEPDTA